MTELKPCPFCGGEAYFLTPKTMNSSFVSVGVECKTFENFYADMGKAPAGCSIDRIDVNGNYCPENCRWVDQKTQQNNRRNNTKITFNGVTETLRYWSEKTGIDTKTLYNRFNKLNWSAEKTILTPLLRQKA